ncbi:MAG: DUF4390 domain-containing protein [Candidatus Electrothrix sp. AW5]|nr:DUF4390 domain-containing protein [Candidatus Electrothrix gigas]MCI5195199.1 DUF4390 domain-containing protein [Candidatus Electrothrix gigas]
MIHILRATFFFLFISALFPAFYAFSSLQAEKDKEPVIDEVVISTTNDYVLLFATVSHCFTDEMLEGVRNGIPLTFRFDIRLNRIQRNWFDAKLIEHKINHTLSYNPIKEEYQVAFAEKKQPEVTRSLKEAKEMMANIDGLRLYPLNNIRVSTPYALKIKATLVENTFPFSMHSIIPFTSLWNFETDWRTVEFSY